MPLIQIFIATYNRPTLVVNAIQSALNQSFDSYEVIVSDNSTDNETEILISRFNDNRFSYKRRIPSLPAINHLNAILKDVTSEYFIIFHDDDIMHPNMLEVLYKNLSHNNDAVAIGANARKIILGTSTKKIFFYHFGERLILKSVLEIANQYIKPKGFIPFPGFLYKSVVSQKIRLNQNHGGKYCDVAFILDVVSLGEVIFLTKPLMDYYIHDDQDSATNVFQERIQLIKYISKLLNGGRKNRLITQYRIKNIFTEYSIRIINKEIPPFSKKNIKIIKLFFKFSPFNYFIKIVVIHLMTITIGGKKIKYIIG